MCIDLRGFGERIRTTRRERGLTQEQLAELANLSSHYIGNLEQGVRTPSLACVMQLCHALGTTPDHLFQDSLSKEMSDGLSVAVGSVHTLRETMDALTEMLSDFLPLEDEETPTLFGMPLHLIPKTPEQPPADSLTEDILLAGLNSDQLI